MDLFGKVNIGPHDRLYHINVYHIQAFYRIFHHRGIFYFHILPLCPIFHRNIFEAPILNTFCMVPNGMSLHINEPYNLIVFHINSHNYTMIDLQSSMELFSNLYHRSMKSVHFNCKEDSYLDGIKYHSFHGYKFHFSYGHSTHHKNVAKLLGCIQVHHICHNNMYIWASSLQYR
jgi:hypothetical protein